MHNVRDRIFEEINTERFRQDTLHGEFNDTLHALSPDFIVMITEELGESAQVLLDTRKYERNTQNFKAMLEAYDAELTQVAALAVQVKERLKKEFGL